MAGKSPSFAIILLLLVFDKLCTAQTMHTRVHTGCTAEGAATRQSILAHSAVHACRALFEEALED